MTSVRTSDEACDKVNVGSDCRRDWTDRAVDLDPVHPDAGLAEWVDARRHRRQLGVLPPAWRFKVQTFLLRARLPDEPGVESDRERLRHGDLDVVVELGRRRDADDGLSRRGQEGEVESAVAF